jgi:hypothetical protein
MKHVTNYEKKDGRTYRADGAGKPAVKNGDPGKPGSGNDSKQPGQPAKQGA